MLKLDPITQSLVGQQPGLPTAGMPQGSPMPDQMEIESKFQMLIQALKMLSDEVNRDLNDSHLSNQIAAMAVKLDKAWLKKQADMQDAMKTVLGTQAIGMM